MIGNDIVDLELAQIESDWKRKGFLNKIFTSSEQLTIFKSEFPQQMVWNLWSRKEAAYKVFNRQTKQRLFNPTQLECFFVHQKDNFAYGMVRLKKILYHTKTEVTSEFIYSEAVCNSMDFDKITPILNPILIKKEYGIPFYFDEKQLVNKPLSITHHGRFMKIITII